MANRTKKPIVAVLPDGTVAERYESTYDCQKKGLKRDWVVRSCNGALAALDGMQPPLYRGLLWMWQEDYDRLVAEHRTKDIRYGPQKCRKKEIVRRIAFTYDWRGRDDDRLVLLFKGATEPILRSVFDYLCGDGAGMARGYELREAHDVERLWRHRYERIEIWLDGYNDRFASLADSLTLVEARLRATVPCEVDFYLIEDWLNLTDRDQRKIDGAWQAVRNGRTLFAVPDPPPPPKPKHRRRKADKKESTNETKTIEDMPKMYVRVPWFVAGFLRGRNDDRQLTEFEPYEFADHDEMMLFMSHNLRFIPEQNQSPYCYSERAFANVLHGKHPGGGKAILNRDASEWPSMNEFCAVTGKFVTDKQDSFDYLCIALPREILDGGRLHKTNGSYALPRHEAETFIAYLRNEFKREFEVFCRRDEEVCLQNGINRSDVDRMERFLANYNMPVSVTAKDREALRKMMFRLRRSRSPKPYIGHELDPFVDHISEEDRKKAGRREVRINREKKNDEKES